MHLIYQAFLVGCKDCVFKLFTIKFINIIIKIITTQTTSD